MSHSSSLYEITSLITRPGMRGKVVVESLVAITADTITITLRDPGSAECITIHVLRDLMPELPEAFEQACRATG